MRFSKILSYTLTQFYSALGFRGTPVGNHWSKHLIKNDNYSMKKVVLKMYNCVQRISETSIKQTIGFLIKTLFNYSCFYFPGLDIFSSDYPQQCFLTFFS